MDEQEKEANYEELLKEATEQAKEKLKGIITSNKLGYQGFLDAEIEKILKEKGIEWHRKNDGVSID